ncbi:MAG TPA: tryptophan--tRNA ligase [Candidatus Paceibacterota bacterium]|nr:tryptophan--tRNA ligase [Candidatus Paceibacterota bacterium]
MSNGRPVLVSGVKPTGDLHIGNYFGAIRQQVELVESGKYRPFIFVADYHALNTMQDAEEMRRRTKELVMAYLAIGLDPKEVVLFKQSDVPAHTELCWIFDSITTMPYLMLSHAFKATADRAFFENNNIKTTADLNNYFNSLPMTEADAGSDTFRSMVSRVFKGIGVGTFNYPMLMAADILLYDAAVVPVGQDQKQHIEYARDTAEKFNRIFKEDVFTLPEPYIMPDVAVVPGTDGQKMSKSYGNVIPLFGSRDKLAKAVMSIVTDSSGKRPENVYAIHKLVKSEKELEPLYKNNRGNYKALKEALIEDLDRYFAPMRERYEALEKDPGAVEGILAEGKQEARAVSEAKMERVRRAIGVA